MLRLRANRNILNIQNFRRAIQGAVKIHQHIADGLAIDHHIGHRLEGVAQPEGAVGMAGNGRRLLATSMPACF